MTRGSTALFAILVAITIVIGFTNEKQKTEIMTHKQENEQLRTEALENSNKFNMFTRKLEEARTIADRQSSIIQKLTKENKTLLQLNEIELGRNKTLMDKNDRILKENAFNLKEVRSMLDTLLLKNCEELLAKDSTAHYRPSPERH